jgi:hypothetical protein
VGEPDEAKDEYGDDYENREDAVHALSLRMGCGSARRMALLLYSQATAIGWSRKNGMGRELRTTAGSP